MSGTPQKYRLKYEIIPPCWAPIVLPKGTELTFNSHYYITDGGFYWTKEVVENNPNYFELIDEPKEEDMFVWTDALVIEVLHLVGRGLISLDKAHDEVQTFKYLKSPNKQSKSAPAAPQVQEKRPDWEIIRVKNKNGAECNFTYWDKMEELQKDGWVVWQVRRLSDGEVFTVGDEIDFADFGNKGPQKIKKFIVDPFDKTQIAAYDGPYGLGLIRWEKVPKKVEIVFNRYSTGVTLMSLPPNIPEEKFPSIKQAIEEAINK